MLDTLERQPISAESRGLARLFRAEVKAVDQQMERALLVILTPIRERLRRRPNVRAESVIEAIRKYRQMVPVRFRVGDIEGARDARAFALAETRLTATWLIDHEWDEPEREKGVSLCRFVLGVRHGRVIERWVPLVSISPHAIGRRIERGADRSHDALFVDIAALADAAGETGEVPTPQSRGQWLGAVVTASGDHGPVKLRNVRTWVPA